MLKIAAGLFSGVYAPESHFIIWRGREVPFFSPRRRSFKFSLKKGK